MELTIAERAALIVNPDLTKAYFLALRESRAVDRACAESTCCERCGAYCRYEEEMTDGERVAYAVCTYCEMRTEF